MAELLARGCNVAIPEVDVGEDIFAFRDGRPPIDRIQVKTAQARRLKGEGRYYAEVRVPSAQLRDLDDPELYYVFSIRLDQEWAEFVIIGRAALDRLCDVEYVGTQDQASGEIRIPLKFERASLKSRGRDLSEFRGAWGSLRVFED